MAAKTAINPDAPRTHELLIEVGTEEMPANYLAYADDPENDLFRKKFREIFESFDESKAFTHGETAVYLTPRRIVIRATGIGFDPAPRKEAVYGPAWQACWDPSGKPTPALEGFIKSRGIRLEDIGEFENKGKKCAGYWKSERPKPLDALLPEMVPAFLKALTFPKTMWWDDSGLRFPRPIRTLLVLLDDKPVKFRVGNLTTGDAIRLFRSGRRFRVRAGSAKKYFALLKKDGVILDQRARRAAIEKDVRDLTAKHGGTYAEDKGLLDEVAFLTERPVCVAGRFDDTYQDLPKEVLTVSLSKKQRLFSVFDKNGKHLPVFVMVLDGGVAKKDVVASTAGAILKAKLQDSHFFWEEDAKTFRRAESVEKLRADLKNLMYLKEMGTMHDKVSRMERVAARFGAEWGLSETERAHLAEAIRLSKVDLLSQMVGEFPELQGVMGGYYVRLAGGAEGVAAAIAEQYLPTSLESALPRTKVGAALSLLDKADLVVACFSSGKLPTSSQDPYALKRSVAGILRLCIEHKIPLAWRKLADAVTDDLNANGFRKDSAKDKLAAQLSAFFAERSAYFFENARGFDPELVQAVLETEKDDVSAIERKIAGLARVSGEEAFKRTLKVVQRTSNILKSVDRKEFGGIEPAHFREEPERQLFERYEQRKKGILDAIEKEDYGQATNLYADAFFDILHIFFEKVLVNSPEPEVRRNRLSLLDSVRSLYTSRIADLSKIKQAAENE